MKKLFLLILIIVFPILASQLGIRINKKKIVVWRFWEKENQKFQEKILMYNPSSIDKEVNIEIAKIIDDGSRVWTVFDSSFASDNYSQLLKPHSFSLIEFPLNPNLHYVNNLFKFKFNTIPVGHLRSHKRRPNTFTDSEKVITTTDSVSLNYDYSIWFEQENIFHSSYKSIVIEYKIKNLSRSPRNTINEISILFEQECNWKYLDNVKVSNVHSITSETLIEKGNKYSEGYGKFIIFKVPENKYLDEHSIRLEIKPKVQELPRIAYIPNVVYIRTFFRTEGNRPFDLPIFLMD